MDPKPPGTLIGVALLGWMERDHALRFLTQECVSPPGTSEADHEAQWREARDRAASLPERPAGPPQEFPLIDDEQEHADRFLNWMATAGMPGLRVIKIDPMQLAIAQYWVALDRAAVYVAKSESAAGWASTALPIAPSSPRLEMRYTRRNLDTDIQIDLPHSEFIFGVHMDSAQYDGTAPSAGPRGAFGPKELLGHISTLYAGSRLLLGKGYHRVYARIAATDAKLPERLSVVAVEPATMNPSPESSSSFAGSESRLDLFGARPALFADFFTEGLVTTVHLRKKQYRLRIQSRWEAVNAE